MQDLPRFISDQERLGRVVRISEPVDPVGEASARLAREEGRSVITSAIGAAAAMTLTKTW
jgi:3-polyprenyl-4-hydroxybenzoate decarboxylase